ncbi:hypothetical protein GCM10007036_21640 [Alsobacter metallidurans]|uniref:BioF2-like acetyltransferase domain-containing protein n=1 Tax=Alsobacter metallidurans TaxID=340221 RepID=A0A917MI52_9HYPH|nr:GNAT family N-acetyltransferase [Alsobacter metallidurans]GGH19040.1 hypothetical protein GCM10007036_21640 [Alsobacter metallidurans]
MRRPSATTTIERSIAAVAREDWDRCFPGEAETWAFYRAVEEAGPPGFDWRYVVLRDQGEVLAVVPAFLTRYELDTTVQGGLKRITRMLSRALPWLMTLRLAALGSPVAERCHIGFAPTAPPERQPELLALMLDAFEAMADAEGCGLMAVKDAGERDMPLWRRITDERGYQPIPGLPTGMLDMPAGGLDGYLATLSRATRKDLRRKMRVREDLRVERRQCVDDVVEAVGALYAETVAHSDLQFEHLPPNYFAAVLRHMPNATIVLYWAGDALVAFNLLIETPTHLVDKYIGMHYPAARRYNLYFISWIENIEYCAKRGIPTYQSGQAFYVSKLRLGCRLSPNWLLFRHRNRVINACLRVVARIVRLDRFDPAIASLMERQT